MNPLLYRPATLLALVLVAMPLTTQAHRSWLLPSATVLSGNEPWVSVDAAVSNDLFYFEHNALKLDGLGAWAPDGSKATAENLGSGRYRNTFDLKLSQKGTYKVALVNETLSATYKLNGETKRARGTSETLAKEIPAEAENVNVTRNQSRVEVFVTSGKPTERVLQAAGQGLELVPITHPNDLFAGDEARFRFLIDGQPAVNLEVTAIPGGVRYRSQLGEIKATTDQDGRFSIKWPAAGMYWLSASHGAAPRPAMDASATALAAPVGTLSKPLRRASYAVTLEVLPQ